eukprot:1142382-Pelagomonas_calceolata.AAC.4
MDLNRSFDFLSNSVLAEVNESVSAAIPGAFSPGVPPAFHANYLAAQVRQPRLLSWPRFWGPLRSSEGAPAI